MFGWSVVGVLALMVRRNDGLGREPRNLGRAATVIAVAYVGRCALGVIAPSTDTS